MKLMTKAIEKRFAQVGRQEDKGDNAIVIAKFFNPCGSWKWYATEYDTKTKTFFGYVKGTENELGYFSLAELQEYKSGGVPIVDSSGNKLGEIGGLGIERDLHFKEMTLGEVMAKVEQGIHV